MNRKEALSRMTMDDEHQYSKLSNEAIELKLAYTYEIECVIKQEGVKE
jgi:hypothetical protein